MSANATDAAPVTVITGASKGIGLALAARRAHAGDRVIGLARRKTGDFPGELLEADLADPDATARAAEGLLGRFGAVRHLVNNVGLVRPAKLGEVRIADLEAVLDLNLRPALQLAQAFLPGMRAAGYGRIVNISSLVALGMPERTAYAAAKAALIGFTRGWALELAKDGITVNSVAPGPTETELFRENNPPGSEGERRYLAQVPMGRLAQPDEIAAAIDFFLAPGSGFVTGQTLYVDGGASIGRAP
jgi:3-oxoacyl-[acyl-carrier protein] reductase